MIYRKLIKFGNSSYVVSLPTDWVKKNNLGKGSTIFIDGDNSDNLMIFPKEEIKKEENSAVLKIDNKSITRIRREIFSLYIKGVDEIIVSSKDLDKISAEIINIFHALMGVEIMETTQNRMVVKDLLDINNVSLDNMIIKIGLITQSLLEDSVKCKTQRDVDNLFQRDENINRIVVFVTRVLNKCIDSPILARKLGINNRDLYNKLNLIINIEKLADLSKWMAENIFFINDKWNKYENDFLILFDEVYKLFIDAMKSYNNKDWDGAVEIADRYVIIMNKTDSILKKHHEPEFVRVVEKVKYILTNTKNIIRLIY